MIDEKRVLVAIPTTGFICEPLVFWMLKAATAGYGDWMFDFTTPCGYSPVEYARNRCVQTFLDHPDAGWLWFWDQDVVPSARSMEMLDVAASGEDMVCGNYPLWVPMKQYGRSGYAPCVFNDKNDEGYQPLYAAFEKPERILASGCGCLLISRKVLEDKRMLLGESQGLIPMFRTPRAADGRQITTEDMDFFDRTRALGYTLTYHSGVQNGHMKQINLAEVKDWLDFAYAEGTKVSNRP